MGSDEAYRPRGEEQAGGPGMMTDLRPRQDQAAPGSFRRFTRRCRNANLSKISPPRRDWPREPRRRFRRSPAGTVPGRTGVKTQAKMIMPKTMSILGAR